MDEVILSRIRQEAYEQGYQDGKVDDYNLAVALMSSAKQERKKGKWKDGCCSECGYNWGKDAPIANVPNYCPNCGARMTDEVE